MEKNEKKKIQRMCLPKGTFIPDAIYFRGNATVSNGNLIIPKGETITFDTYFNMFPLFKWRRYTRIADLYVNVRLQGNARIELRGINRSKDDATKFDDPITLNTVECQNQCSDDTTLLQCGNIDDLADFIYLSIHAESEVRVEDIIFSTSAERSKDLNIACCFCTYKREADIKKNVENLLGGIVHNDDSDLKDRLHVYVADNGHTLPLDLYAKEPAVHLFYNKNYGGAGGFTRCMIETCFRNEGKPFSHIILMDDDALILPEVVERTGALLSILKEEYSDYMVGGAMLCKDAPAIQYENGVLLDTNNMKSLYRGRGWNLSVEDNVLLNENAAESEINYNAWWYTCISTQIVKKDNLPLPLFIHGDDKEFGIRNGGHFIRMNGICVWHPRFSTGSKIRLHMVYYDTRNNMLVQYLHNKHITTAKAIITLIKRTYGAILNYRYQELSYILKGYDDYYKGIEYFKAVEPEELNKKLMGGEGYKLCVLTSEEMKDIRLVNEEFSPVKRYIRKISNWALPAWKKRVVYNDQSSASVPSQRQLNCQYAHFIFQDITIQA